MTLNYAILHLIIENEVCQNWPLNLRMALRRFIVIGSIPSGLEINCVRQSPLVTRYFLAWREKVLSGIRQLHTLQREWKLMYVYVSQLQVALNT